MRVFTDGYEYQGTPQEIAELFGLLNPQDTGDMKVRQGVDSFPPEDFVPLESLVDESAELRKKLAQDPSYSPFGGVVPSKEAEPDILTKSRESDSIVDSSADTGVQLV